jgi:hypothetical protein
MATFVPKAQAAAALECTREMAMRSEEAVVAAKDWKSLYRNFQAYAVCDDGAIAEGFSDRVEYLMTHRWRDMGKFLPLKTDKDFGKFVLRHVDGTMSEEGIKQILLNAQTRCPTGYREFCRSIEAAAAHP